MSSLVSSKFFAPGYGSSEKKRHHELLGPSKSESPSKKEKSNLEKHRSNDLLKLSLLNSQSPFKKDFQMEAKKFAQKFLKNSSSPSDSFEDSNAISPEWINSSFDRDLENMNFKVEPMEMDEMQEKVQVKAETIDSIESNMKKIDIDGIKREPMDTNVEKEENLESLLCNLKRAISDGKIQRQQN
jgi:hypothetical protein